MSTAPDAGSRSGSVGYVREIKAQLPLKQLKLNYREEWKSGLV
jgi:hypothetical protein